MYFIFYDKRNIFNQKKNYLRCINKKKSSIKVGGGILPLTLIFLCHLIYHSVVIFVFPTQENFFCAKQNFSCIL